MIQWRRAQSCSGGQCIEVARDGDEYLIRDSKKPEIAPMRFTRPEWTAFVRGVEAGEFRF